MSYPKIAKIVEILYERTINGKLEWETTNQDNVFQTSFTNYTIRIHYKTVEDPWIHTITEFYIIEIYNSEGKLIESADNFELRDHIKESTTAMKEMYEGARRMALKVDKALNDILMELGEDENKDKNKDDKLPF